MGAVVDETGSGRTPVARRRGAGFLVAMLALAILAALAQVLDLVTFLRVVSRHGVTVETNPVARALVALVGLVGLAGVKLLVAILVPAALAYRARVGRAPRLATLALVTAIAIGLFGSHSNLVTLDRMGGGPAGGVPRSR